MRETFKVCDHIEIECEVSDNDELPDTTNTPTTDVTCKQCGKTYHFIFEGEGAMSNEKLYIGAKLIRAYPADKDGVVGYNVTYPDGYFSWSPKDVFEEAYREVSSTEKSMVTG